MISRVTGPETGHPPPSNLRSDLWECEAEEDPGRGPEARLQAAAPPPLPLGCLTSLPPSATRVPGGGPAYRVTAATQPPASADPRRGCAGWAAPGEGAGERMCSAARRAAPGGVAVTGATGARAGSAAAALALQQRAPAAAVAAEAAGGGESPGGWDKGPPSLPRPTRDLGLGAPLIHLWPQVRRSGCGGPGPPPGVPRAAGHGDGGQLRGSEGRSGGGRRAGRCDSRSPRNAPSPPPPRSPPSACAGPPKCGWRPLPQSRKVMTFLGCALAPGAAQVPQRHPPLCIGEG